MSHNALTEAYLAAFAATGGPASRVLEGVRSGTVDTSYEGRCLSRPVFLDRLELDRVARDTDLIRRLLADLPDRLYGGDLAAFARAVGATPAQAAAVARGPATPPPPIARADYYRDDTGFRLIEVNWGAALGGLDNAELNRAMLTEPFVRDFVAEHELTYVDSTVELVDTMLTEANVPSGVRPVVALADWPASFTTLEPQLRRSAGRLAAAGVDAYPCHLGQLRYADGRVWLGERAVDIVYRLFLMEALLDPSGPPLIAPVLQAAERGEVTIFAPLETELFGSKGALALLSDEANRSRFAPDDLAGLDRILPWTRFVRSGPVTVDGARYDLWDYALAEQAELILKPTMMHGGIGVVAGWQVTAAEWQERVEAALDAPYVLQRRIHPRTEPFPTDQGLEEWTPVWGTFVVSHGYGGMYIRAGRDRDNTVNIATGATGTCCFHERVRAPNTGNAAPRSRDGIPVDSATATSA